MTGTIILIARTGDVVPRSIAASLPSRHTELGDQDALAQLFYAAYQAAGLDSANGGVDSLDQAKQIVTDLFAGEYGPFLPEASPVVLNDSGEIVAASLVVERRAGEGLPDAPYIFELFTDSAHRRQGLAERLVRESAFALKEAGHERVSLRIREDNSPALALYLTLDFNRWQQQAEDDEL
ncbi:GNAT family N-acetyltransferase [Kocuria sp.]|uniref:GNAT family N-acetyltransferase n=1 Tax=Kocuria sp. TaxID=1871328 RepID=UPI0026E087C6|nr:GNAT family N-acetyltransferase [Kocuria sp.]MDO5619825.1 GNAT family N-acetyltransferase [Kocuria sp.]